jgi:hypothetical protein
MNKQTMDCLMDAVLAIDYMFVTLTMNLLGLMHDVT